MDEAMRRLLARKARQSPLRNAAAGSFIEQDIGKPLSAGHVKR
jgi:hypothetical protein